MNELAQYCVRAGHEVNTISTHPQEQCIEETLAGRRYLKAPLSRGWMKRARLEETHLFYFTARKALRSLQADAIHSFYFSDGLAAAHTQRFHRARVMLQMNGFAVPGYSCHRYFPPEGWIFAEAMRQVDVRIACSQWVREKVLEHYKIDSIVIPPILNVNSWEVGSGPPDGRPTIVSAADFEVRRKGLRVLVKAFQLLKRAYPDALLRLSGRMSRETEREVLDSLPESIRNSIENLGIGRAEDLARLYQTASVTVLPAMFEPSGMVLFESWACGTPIVTANHGGVAEYVVPGVGVLFEPGSGSNGEEADNSEGLMVALVEALQMSQLRETRQRCHRYAERYSFEALGPRIEALYRGESISAPNAVQTHA